MYASRGLRDNLGDSPKQRVGNLGQNPTALVLRWRQSWSFKFNIFIVNALISINKVSVAMLTIKACSENNFGLIQAKFSWVALIKFVTFFGSPVEVLQNLHPHLQWLVLLSLENQVDLQQVVFQMLYLALFFTQCNLLRYFHSLSARWHPKFRPYFRHYDEHAYDNLQQSTL